jgi:hypothetical protein
MRKLVLFLIPISLFAQHVFSPLGMNLLEMGWRYFQWNPANLKAIGSDGIVVDFHYATDYSSETIWFAFGYQEAQKDLAGELLLERLISPEDGEYGLTYSLAGKSGNYFWGVSTTLYKKQGDFGLRLGGGVTGENNGMMFSLAMKDFTVLNSSMSSVKPGEVGAAFGWLTENFGIHLGAITTMFKVFEVYSGVAGGISPVFFGVSFGYATDMKSSSYHATFGVAWQGNGILLAGNFDYVVNPYDFEVGSFKGLENFPYRFSVVFKLPFTGEGKE